jgi:fatty-acyl-CoA synthase
VSGGQNIYPSEIERVLAAHPAVAEVSVVGAPDPVWGENVCAFVVRRAGMEVTEAELVTTCLASLASYKKPKAVHFVDSLPKNVLGKVLKRELRAGLVVG